ncbi:unnamed protein product [Porites lobata]|uniref:CTHRC1 C-terminal domain-containing protein n=1 Tax=Porites lobata TaxID=104759 RepID=A0ABN8P2C5_9CNID|nr:unnamed protein product [Porites lobata]
MSPPCKIFILIFGLVTLITHALDTTNQQNPLAHSLRKCKEITVDCVFYKNFSDTALRVSWTGAFRVYKCTSCCKRWYFTFNGAECSAPLAIDGIVYVWQGKTQDPHRVRHIEGHCNNIHKGRVRVGFWVGNCQHGVAGDASTGWQSVSRIFIEEVPKAQSLP